MFKSFSGKRGCRTVQTVRPDIVFAAVFVLNWEKRCGLKGYCRRFCLDHFLSIH